MQSGADWDSQELKMCGVTYLEPQLAGLERCQNRGHGFGC